MPIRDIVNSWLFAVLLVLLVLSLVIHSLTYFNYDPRGLSLRLWYGLQLSSAAAFAASMIVSRRHDQKRSGLGQSTNKPLPRIDNLVVGSFGLALVYAIFNWMFTLYVLLHGDTPEVVNGQYTLGADGTVTTVSKEVFMKALVYEARMSSGHWMALYLLAMSTWLWRLREPGD